MSRRLLLARFGHTHKLLLVLVRTVLLNGETMFDCGPFIFLLAQLLFGVFERAFLKRQIASRESSEIKITYQLCVFAFNRLFERSYVGNFNLEFAALIVGKRVARLQLIQFADFDLELLIVNALLRNAREFVASCSEFALELVDSIRGSRILKPASK